MKQWIIIATTSLLLVACHRGKKDNVTDNDTISPTKSDTTIICDTITTTDSVTNNQLTLQREKVQITNGRILKSKKVTIYSPTLLIGEWKQGDEHIVFYTDKSGIRWDSDDDVSREEAMTFHWKMENNELVIEYPLKMGGVVVKQYTVTFVDEETLAYEDLYGSADLWEKEG